jgi:hypothetical protein
VEDTPPPNLQPEHQEKGHSFHALSCERQAGQSGLPHLLAPGILKIQKSLEPAGVFLILDADAIARA